MKLSPCTQFQETLKKSVDSTTIYLLCLGANENFERHLCFSRTMSIEYYRRNRRFRVAVVAIQFNNVMEKIRLSLQWGNHAQHYQHFLLECTDQSLPDSYFTMPKTFPPGWLLKKLPEQLRDQIETYAKNVLARLFTPLAKRHATRTFLKWLRLKEGNILAKVTPQTLKTESRFFDCFDDESLETLIKESSVRVYPPGWWLHLPSRSPSTFLPGFLILEGSFRKVTKSPNDSSPTIRHPATVMEAASILRTPTTEGVLAVSKCIALEFPPTSIVKLVSHLLGNESGKNLKLKSFITQSLSSQMQSHFPLTEKMLHSTSYFRTWDIRDLKTLVHHAMPCVAFPKEKIQLSNHGKQNLDYIMFISRGSANLSRLAVGDHPEQTTQPPTCYPPKAFHSTRGTSTSHSLHAPHLQLLSGDIFGADFCVLEDSCNFQLAASASDFPLEYWIIPRSSLLSFLRSTLALQNECDNSISNRVQLLRQMVPLERLGFALGQHQLLQGAPCGLIQALALKCTPCVFKAGERAFTVGDTVSALFIVTSGKISQLRMGIQDLRTVTSQSEPSTFTPDTLAGEGFLRRHPIRWTHSYSASRVTECWELRRGDCQNVLKQFAFPSTQNVKLQRTSLLLFQPTPPQTSSKPRSTVPEFRTEARVAMRKQQRERAQDEDEKKAKVFENLRHQLIESSLPASYTSFFQREGVQPCGNHVVQLCLRPQNACRASKSLPLVRIDSRNQACGLDYVAIQNLDESQITIQQILSNHEKSISNIRDHSKHQNHKNKHPACSPQKLLTTPYLSTHSLN